MDSTAYINACVVCGQKSTRAMKAINSVSGRNNVLRQLLVRFGGLSITRGSICNADLKILRNLSRQADQFYSKCQKTTQKLVSKDSQFFEIKSTSHCDELAILANHQMVSPENGFQRYEVSRTDQQNSAIMSDALEDSISYNKQSDCNELSMKQVERNVIKSGENINHPRFRSLLLKPVSTVETSCSVVLNEPHKDEFNVSSQDTEFLSNDAELHVESILCTDSLNNTALCTLMPTMGINLNTNKSHFKDQLKDIIFPNLENKLTPQLLTITDVRRITLAARTRSPDVLVSVMFDITELRLRIEEKFGSRLSQSGLNSGSRISSNGHVLQIKNSIVQLDAIEDKIQLENKLCKSAVSKIINNPATVAFTASDDPFLTSCNQAGQNTPVKEEKKTIFIINKNDVKHKISFEKDPTNLSSDISEKNTNDVDYFPSPVKYLSEATSKRMAKEVCEKAECIRRFNQLTAECIEVSEGQDSCEQFSATLDGLNKIPFLHIETGSDVLGDNISDNFAQNVKVQSHSKPRRRAHSIRNVAKSCKSFDKPNNRKKARRKSGNNESVSSDDSKSFELKRTEKNALNICHVCGKIFQTRLACKNHCRFHTSEKLFTCEICGKAFGTKRDMNEHSRIHTGESPYQCEQCGKSFKASGVFAKHRRYHASSSQDASFFTCPKCNKIMPMKRARSHMDSQCLSNECDQCHRVFSRPDSLALHKNVAHAGKLGYICAMCDRKFAWSANLRIHMKRHQSATNTCESEQSSNKPVGCYRQRKEDRKGEKKKMEDVEQFGVIVTSSGWSVNQVEKVS